MRVVYAIPMRGEKTWCPLLRRVGGNAWLLSYFYMHSPVKSTLDIPADRRPEKLARMPKKQRKGFDDGQRRQSNFE